MAKRAASMKKVNKNEAVTIVIAEGTAHERAVELPAPKGKKARKVTALLLPLMSPMAEAMGDKNKKEISFVEISNMVKQLWSDDDFEDKVYPLALCLDIQADAEFLEELSLMEMMTSFMEAATHWVFGSLDSSSPEELAALEKK